MNNYREHFDSIQRRSKRTADRARVAIKAARAAEEANTALTVALVTLGAGWLAIAALRRYRGY